MASKREDTGLLGPLFDNLDSDSPEESPPEPPEEELAEESAIYTVSELAMQIRDKLREGFPMILVRGEIADFKGIHRSGHLYFGLKDDSAQIRAVMWKPFVSKLPFKIEAGQEVIATAKVDYYPGGGSLQIVIEHLEPVGIGALQLKFEQLKKKLKEEGLFALERKREIPAINWRVGIVTGRSTAALQDMLKIFRHRFPMAEVFLFHASVQGEQAPKQICEAIRLANTFSQQSEKPLDCLIVGRGGGSYEDLFCFNDEDVARAIVASELPVVSGIGHEIDVTIADMVADKRAATPTHAAQLVVPDVDTWLERLTQIRERITQRTRDRIQDYRQNIDVLYNRLVAASPQKQLQIQRENIARLRDRISRAIQSQLEGYRYKIQAIAGRLDALSPLKVFDRGYAIIQGHEGHVLRSVKELKKDDIVTLRLKDGTKQSRVL